MKLTLPLCQLIGHSMYLEANFANGPDNTKGKKEEEEGEGTHQDTAATRRKFSTGTQTHAERQIKSFTTGAVGCRVSRSCPFAEFSERQW